MTRTADGPHLLLVEDDADIARLVIERLTTAGFVVDYAASIAAADARVRSQSHRLFIVDWMLPDGAGVDWIAAQREQGNRTPICMLTAKDALEDKLAGFSAGVDDYLAKPFALEELQVRVLALLKRSTVAFGSDTGLTVGDLEVHEDDRRVRVKGRPVDLTRREFDVLSLLVARQGKAVHREQIVQVAWPAHREVNFNTVDVYVSYLRKKLETSSVVIETVRGVGFRLVAEPSSP